MKFAKFISAYLFIYLLVASLLFTVVKYRKDALFNSQTLETMLSSPSIYKGTVTDPCQYYIKGEPRDFPEDYAKVILYCSPSTSSANSLALPAIVDHSVIGVLRELGRLHGFTVGVDDGLTLGSLSPKDGYTWECYNDLGSKMVSVSINHNIQPKQVIKCFYSNE